MILIAVKMVSMPLIHKRQISDFQLGLLSVALKTIYFGASPSPFATEAPVHAPGQQHGSSKEKAAFDCTIWPSDLDQE